MHCEVIWLDFSPDDDDDDGVCLSLAPLATLTQPAHLEAVCLQSIKPTSKNHDYIIVKPPSFLRRRKVKVLVRHTSSHYWVLQKKNNPASSSCKWPIMFSVQHIVLPYGFHSHDFPLSVCLSEFRGEFNQDFLMKKRSNLLKKSSSSIHSLTYKKTVDSNATGCCCCRSIATHFHTHNPFNPPGLAVVMHFLALLFNEREGFNVLFFFFHYYITKKRRGFYTHTKNIYIFVVMIKKKNSVTSLFPPVNPSLSRPPFYHT